MEPLTGASWIVEFSHLDSCCFDFDQFVRSFAAQFPDDLQLIQVDHAAAHTADSLTIPDNVILIFQPPYCLEVNPIERVWQDLKRDLACISLQRFCDH
ncbi:transposase [Parathermosynechococcus lividus]